MENGADVVMMSHYLAYEDRTVAVKQTFPNGFYDKLIEFFDEIISQKFARDTAKKLYFIANTPREAIEYIKNYQPENLAISKADIYTR